VTPAPTLPFDDTTADDLACAAAVLADAADRAQRLASLYRTPDHWAWAERATRAHAAVVRLTDTTNGIDLPNDLIATTPLEDK